MQKDNIFSNKIAIVLLLTLLVRILCILIIDKIPCMESDYFFEGKNIFEGIPTIIYLSPFYSTLVFALSTLFDSLFYASSLIFILSSTAVSFYVYSICRLWFNESTAYTSLLFLLFLPNVTVAIAGYSHSVVLGIALELSALYHLLLYFNKNTIKNFLQALVFTILSIFIRPELLVVLIPFYFILFIHHIWSKGIIKSYKKMILGVFFLLCVPLSVFTHKMFVESRSIKKETAGIFTDKTYSYFTFIHTYSIRYFEAIDNQKAIIASKPFIGTPEENNYSISTAILKNPVQFATNVLFNCKEILDSLAHPLFLPFYFYFFIGILFTNSIKSNYLPFFLLSALFILHMIPLIIFHVEIRYLQALCLLIIVLVASGESTIDSKIYRNTAVCFTFIIFIMYLINNKNMISLCG